MELIRRVWIVKSEIVNDQVVKLPPVLKEIDFFNQPLRDPDFETWFWESPDPSDNYDAAEEALKFYSNH